MSPYDVINSKEDVTHFRPSIGDHKYKRMPENNKKIKG